MLCLKNLNKTLIISTKNCDTAAKCITNVAIDIIVRIIDGSRTCHAHVTGSLSHVLPIDRHEITVQSVVFHKTCSVSLWALFYGHEFQIR